MLHLGALRKGVSLCRGALRSRLYRGASFQDVCVAMCLNEIIDMIL